MACPIESKIKKGDTGILIIPGEQYPKEIINVCNCISNNYTRICYVSLNRTFGALVKNLEKANVDLNKFMFIDGIAKGIINNPKPERNCIYISSPGALTELSIVISRTLEKAGIAGIDFLFFDSLSTLLIYNKSDIVCKFVHNLIQKINAAGTLQYLPC